ncbi:MAG: DUF5320 domain-containing protein [Deltaproteobacteria bacterium]|nr:DUF5320 domain-containing protein [Deltaproteobacteria bacterium]
MNEGPMTGGGRGYCTGAVDPAQGFAGRGNAMGMGRQRGRRGYQAAPGQGRGFSGSGQWNMPAPATASTTQATLQNRANMLEAELAAIKKQMKNFSE